MVSPPPQTEPRPANRTVALAVGAFVIVGILIAAGQVAVYGFVVKATNTSARYATGSAGSTRIECSPVESLATHYHFALRIHRDGREDVLPSQTGISAFCLYWIHVHDDSGIVHIEAPAADHDHVFNLADVFAVAGERLDANHLGSSSFSTGAIAVYVDGTRWDGAPGAVPLADLETIDIVAPGQPFRYQPFAWPDGFGPPPTV